MEVRMTTGLSLACISILGLMVIVGGGIIAFHFWDKE